MFSAALDGCFTRNRNGPVNEKRVILLLAGSPQHAWPACKGIGRDDIASEVEIFLVNIAEYISVLSHRRTTPRISVHRYTTAFQLGARGTVEANEVVVAQLVGDVLVAHGHDVSESAILHVRASTCTECVPPLISAPCKRILLLRSPGFTSLRHGSWLG